MHENIAHTSCNHPVLHDCWSVFWWQEHSWVQPFFDGYRKCRLFDNIVCGKIASTQPEMFAICILGDAEEWIDTSNFVYGWRENIKRLNAKKWIFMAMIILWEMRSWSYSIVAFQRKERKSHSQKSIAPIYYRNTVPCCACVWERLVLVLRRQSKSIAAHWWLARSLSFIYTHFHFLRSFENNQIVFQS